MVGPEKGGDGRVHVEIGQRLRPFRGGEGCGQGTSGGKRGPGGVQGGGEQVGHGNTRIQGGVGKLNSGMPRMGGDKLACPFRLRMNGVDGLRLFHLRPVAAGQHRAHEANAIVQGNDKFRHDNPPSVWATAAR